jgi:hypothetical protein
VPPEASTADSIETVTMVPSPAARRGPGFTGALVTGAGGAQAGAGEGAGVASHGPVEGAIVPAYVPLGAADPAPACRVAGSCHGLAPAGSPVAAHAHWASGRGSGVGA